MATEEKQNIFSENTYYYIPLFYKANQLISFFLKKKKNPHKLNFPYVADNSISKVLHKTWQLKSQLTVAEKTHSLPPFSKSY